MTILGNKTILISILISVAAVAIIFLVLNSFSNKQAYTSTSIQLVANPKPQLTAKLINCTYQTFKYHHEQDSFWFFFQITNVGDASTRLPSSIYLVPENSIPAQTNDGMVSGKSLPHIYGKNEVLWGEIQRDNGITGNEWYWEISPRKDFNYRLAYCEFNCMDIPVNDTFNLRDGLVTYGLVIYKGSTSKCTISQLS